MRRLLVMLLMILMATTLLGGCSGNSKPAGDPEPTASGAIAGQPNEQAQQKTDDKGKESPNGATVKNDVVPVAPKDNAQQKPKQLPVYETMKEYKYDIDGNQKIDNFSLETDGINYVNLFINEWGYSVSLEDITPELLYQKYKLLKINGSNKYAFALYVASPPNDYEVYIYTYEDKGYGKSDSGKKESEELREIGVATIDLGLFNYNFSTLFNSEVQLSLDQVTIGGHTFTFNQ